MKYPILLAACLALASCENMPAHETAMHGLRVFCTLYRAEIINLSPQQAQAAQTVCTYFNLRTG